ncbi:hypothetical protein E2562_026924 [Oryza meyeriana var. granulata]|uniref:Uncharacterized protein n=1 Tax=Oryza meyeriana var. granulata TaxID=110450 RepID=A0A6G1CRX9_9ORYZ|nr:hypothetical protein E2562_026924 [Oryza meyeriana var. granulata]
MGDHQEMKYCSSARLGRRWWRRPAARGFRLSPTRLSVRRLRARLWTLLGLLGRCVRNVRLLTRGLVVASGGGGGGSTSPSTMRGGGRRVLAVLGGKDAGAAVAGRRAQPAPAGGKDGSTAGGNKAARRPPCTRSNSFYARAVAECLEFIKGSNAGGATPARDNRVK